MRTQNIALDGTYTINHNYGSMQIKGLRNALNIYHALWMHYHTDSYPSDYNENRVKIDLKNKGYHEDDCGYLDIHVQEEGV